MYVEKRKLAKVVKYYLVHSYRKKTKVEKIRTYLGKDLTKEELQRARKEAEARLAPLLHELNTEVFLFSLTKGQLDRLNNYSIKIVHLDKRAWDAFAEEFVYNTNAIEGSTVRRDEVSEIIENPRTLNSEELETKGVAEAIEYIRTTKEELSLELLKKMHRLCFDGSKHFAGTFRTVEVVIRNAGGEVVHQGVPVAKLHLALQDMIRWYNENKTRFRPLALAAILHNQFEYIHPFQDGNGRVGRLLLNFILLKNRYPPINIALENRAEYYMTLQEYQINQNLRPTMEFLVKQYKKTVKQVTARKRRS